MCTVTFIPKSLNDFVLTSNRDEAPSRATILPSIYEINSTKMLFPKDALAGGTWIGTSDKNRLVCLLNGGFEPHKRQGSYRMSRGVIVTDLLGAADIKLTIKSYDFRNIEPFTIILVNWINDLELHELVWDGTKTHFSEKPLMPHIWSSSLLYSESDKKKRESWFSDFIFNNLRPTETELLDFHKTAGEGDSQTNLIMDKGFVKTKSISQFSKKEPISNFRYEDLETQEIAELSF